MTARKKKAEPACGRSVLRAAEVLREGGVVAIPTETVYGLAGNIFDEKAIRAIYRIKKRPSSNPLIVHVAGLEQARELVTRMPPAAEKLARAFWPGPLTLILPKKKKVPGWVTAGQDTVGLRVPDHPLTLRLLRTLDFPLAAPSANPFTYISPVTADQVARMLGKQTGYILDGGRCRAGIESTIVSFEKGKARILRPGAIPEEAIKKVVGTAGSPGKKPADILHPGMYKKHYSPRTPLLLTRDVETAWKTRAKGRTVLLAYGRKYPFAPPGSQRWLGRTPAMVARRLYDVLHQLDREGYDLIIAPELPEIDLGRAVNDRLRKAARRD